MPSPLVGPPRPRIGAQTATQAVLVQRPPRHIEFLDHVRAVAVLSVLAYHTFLCSFHRSGFAWNGWHVRVLEGISFLLLSPFTTGWSGVPIFFVVSGFCIHLSFARRPDWKEFWSRRFFRIYPPYLAALLVFAFLFPLSRLHFRSPHDISQLGAHLALVHNFFRSTFLGVNAAFWSIAVEAQLYVLYPVLLFLTGRIGWKKTLLFLALIEVSLRVVDAIYLMHDASGDDRQRVEWILIGCPLFYWCSWSLGAFLSEQYMRQNALPFTSLSVPLLAVAFIASQLIPPLSAFSFILVSLLTATIIAKMLSRPATTFRIHGAFSSCIARIGLWSYSIYLLHLPILFLVAHLLEQSLPSRLNRHWVIFFLLLLSWLGIVPLSGAWYRLIELPSIALGKRFLLTTGQRAVRPAALLNEAQSSRD